VVVYMLLIAAWRLRRRIVLPALIRAPLFVFALNVAFLLGFCLYLRGDFSGQWRRTERA
jgi:hypothetical protein